MHRGLPLIFTTTPQRNISNTATRPTPIDQARNSFLNLAYFYCQPIRNSIGDSCPTNDCACENSCGKPCNLSTGISSRTETSDCLREKYRLTFFDNEALPAQLPGAWNTICRQHFYRWHYRAQIDGMRPQPNPSRLGLERNKFACSSPTTISRSGSH